jgi:hypothetical protein
MVMLLRRGQTQEGAASELVLQRALSSGIGAQLSRETSAIDEKMDNEAIIVSSWISMSWS